MKKRHLHVFLSAMFLFLSAMGSSAYSQTIQANPDNYYVSSGVVRTFDVIANDEPGMGCASSPEDLVLELVSPTGAGGNFQLLSIVNNRLRFRSVTGFYGQLIVEYKITCTNGNTSSTGKVYINVGNTPDFVDVDATCTVDPVPFVWDIEKKAQSSETEYVQCYANPMVGDVDGDGHLEIVTINNAVNGVFSGNLSDQILIFNPDLTLKKRITTPRMNTYVTVPMALVNVDGGPDAYIIVATGYDAANLPNTYRLRAYKADGTLVWTSSDTYIQTYDATVMHYSAVTVVDLDGDGNIELLAGDRLFDAKTGHLLATLPTGGRGRSTNASGANRYGYLPCFGDVDGDGIQEVVCGNTVYKVTINDRNNPALNTAVMLASVDLKDGYTSVADIDGDGILDVVVVSSYDLNKPTITQAETQMYVWQGSSGSLIGTVQVPTPGKRPGATLPLAAPRGGSRAFIGDINNDGRPEICFTHDCKMDAYGYNPVTKVLTALWTDKYTSDTSAATTMSMFDFNNDGEVELVYRDETDLRILNKNGDNTTSFPCFSGTHTEYPVIVDLDGDGHAEIVVSGSVGAIDNTKVRLMIFGSITPKTWAPARKVWHQHAYNPLMVNEDLTIPVHPMYPTMKVGSVKEDGTVVEGTPFNGFLQQSGKLSTDGKSLTIAPDLAFSTTESQKLFYNPTTKNLEVTVFLSNNGSVAYNGNLVFGLYAYNVTTSQYQLVGTETILSNQSFAIFENKTYTFNIANFDVIEPGLPLADNRMYYVTVNKVNNSPNAPIDPTSYTTMMRECQTWNNMSGRIAYVSGYTLLCEGETGNLSVNPAGVYDCYWYAIDNTNTKVAYPNAATNKNDIQSVTKSSNYKDFYLIDVYAKGSSNKITTDSVFVYMAPDTLVWRGTQNSDWHNVSNWSLPNDDSRQKEISYIPHSCTNILITDGCSYYPNLTSGSTDYSIYSTAVCNNITLEHGGEVVASYSLTYQKAYVQLTTLGNRWYCFTPPLRNFYAGDIFISNPNPIFDNLIVYTRLFQESSPQWGNHFNAGGWSRTFYNPDYSFGPGQTMGIWLDDGADNSIHNSILTTYPKNVSTYYVYNDDGSIDTGKPAYPVLRTNSHRFLYEETLNSSTKAITLSVIGETAGKEIMIGNPLMSHLDFDKFYAANSSLIEPSYRVMGLNYQYNTYNSTSGIGTGGLTKDIAPMQAIIVKVKNSFPINSLVVTPSMALVKSGDKLRNSPSLQSSQDVSEYLNISLNAEGTSSYAVLLHTEDTGADLSYNSSVDVVKMMSETISNIPYLYIISSDGYYLEMKNLSDPEGVDVPLGLRWSKTGSMSLIFDNLWSFMPGFNDIYLYDKLLNKTIKLRESSIYSFEKNNSDLYVDDRFVLRFLKISTSIDKEETNGRILGFKTQDRVGEVYTYDGSPLGLLRIYDLQGRLLESKTLSTSHYSLSLPEGVYLIKSDVLGKSVTLKVVF